MLLIASGSSWLLQALSELEDLLESEDAKAADDGFEAHGYDDDDESGEPGYVRARAKVQRAYTAMLETAYVYLLELATHQKPTPADETVPEAATSNADTIKALLDAVKAVHEQAYVWNVTSHSMHDGPIVVPQVEGASP